MTMMRQTPKNYSRMKKVGGRCQTGMYTIDYPSCYESCGGGMRRNRLSSKQRMTAGRFVLFFDDAFHEKFLFEEKGGREKRVEVENRWRSI